MPEVDKAEAGIPTSPSPRTQTQPNLVCIPVLYTRRWNVRGSFSRLSSDDKHLFGYTRTAYKFSYGLTASCERTWLVDRDAY